MEGSLKIDITSRDVLQFVKAAVRDVEVFVLGLIKPGRGCSPFP